MSQPLRPGEIVYLKSGGPAMTVASVRNVPEQNLAIVEWFSDGSPCRSEFDAATLTTEQPDERDEGDEDFLA